jgi:hypothetical protein
MFYCIQVEVPKQVCFLDDSGCMAIHEKILQFGACLYSLVEAKFHREKSPSRLLIIYRVVL